MLKSATRVLPPRGPGARRGGDPRVLDLRSNSLNLLRLVLAACVLVSHCFPLAGRHEPQWAGDSLGGWSVIGFFAVSGYLITGSRLRSSGARYLVQRLVRIMPGYLVCLAVVAFAMAPVAYLVERGSLSGFLTTPNTPLNYIYGNLFLRISDYSVAGTLANTPYPKAWNGSLWSLYFEFLCYIFVGLAVIVPWVRTRAWPMVALFGASVFVWANLSHVLHYMGVGNYEFTLLAKLLPYFLGGSVVYVLRERLPLHWYGAVVALGVGLTVVVQQPVWGGQLCAPLFAYAIMWLASALPSPRLLQKHDFSYGVYIYAFPVTQLLAVFGLERSFPLFMTSAVLITAVFAVASWFLVERPAKRLAREPVRVRAAGPADAGPAVLEQPDPGRQRSEVAETALTRGALPSVPRLSPTMTPEQTRLPGLRQGAGA